MGLYADALLSAAPVLILIYLMVKRKPWPSYLALPFSALLMYLLKLGYFASDPALTNATVLTGLLTSLTPTLIIWGAILLFTTMERSGGLDIVRNWLNNISPNRVAQLMIIGWAFSFMIEGASGFGTPVALAAPLLVGLGFDAFRVALLCLVMNSVPVSFGAVGTPTWFGFGELGLSAEQIAEIGWKTALMHAGAALVIPLVALRFVESWAEIRRNLVYVYLSVFACVIPYVAIAFWSYEFPALAAGLIGFVLSVVFARLGWGLHNSGDEGVKGWQEGVSHSPYALVKALFPLWGCVLLLVVTRIKQLGLKPFLEGKTATGDWSAQLGTLGELKITEAGVLTLSKVFGTPEAWSLKLLYVPALIPFVVVSLLTVLWCRTPARGVYAIATESLRMMKHPAITLGGALILVGLMMSGGSGACSAIMGDALAKLAGGGWFYCAPFLGVVGAFFSGSNTVSNMTFGPIQLSAAQSLGLDPTTILALQSVGGALGHMVCINNIVAVGSILGLSSVIGFEGRVLRQTFLPTLAYGALALLVALFV